jgi:hypothetical protein
MGDTIVIVPYLGGLTVLGLAGAIKLRDPRLASAAVRRIGLDRHAETAVRLVAVLELGLAVTGWSGVSAPFVAGGAALLYAVFVATTVSLLRQGLPVSCGCFGVRSVTVTALHVALNVASCAVCVAAAATGSRLSAADTPSWAIALAAEALLVAALLAATYTSLEPAPYLDRGERAAPMTNHVHQERPV